MKRSRKDRSPSPPRLPKCQQEIRDTLDSMVLPDVPLELIDEYRVVADCIVEQEPTVEQVLRLECSAKSRAAILEKMVSRQLYCNRLSEPSAKVRQRINSMIQQNQSDEVSDRISASGYPDRVKQMLLSEYNKVKDQDECTDKTSVMHWVELALSVPTRTKGYPINCTSSIEECQAFSTKLAGFLEQHVYGMLHAKQIIQDFIFRKVRNGPRSRVLALVGPPGVGKTTLAKCIALSTELPRISIKLGGANDVAKLVGFSRTYSKSTCGQLLKELVACGVIDPIIEIDEVDKSSGKFGNDIQNKLTHMLDESQNNEFTDEYLGFGIDLSQVFWILTFNDKNKIDPILLDRMTIVDISDYSRMEKAIMCKEFLIPRILESFGSPDITIPDETIAHIVSDAGGDKITGVRYIVDRLELLFGRLNRLLMTGTIVQPVKVSPGVFRLFVDMPAVKSTVMEHLYL